MTPRHCRGAAIRQEDAEPDQRGEDGCGDGQTGQRRRSQMADDRGVGQHHERFTDQREKRWYRDTKDLPISRGKTDRGHGLDLWTGAWATRE
jgi:hypothetical protein